MTTSKIVIVTGAGRGLGSEIASLAYSLGYSVALISKTTSDLIDVQKQILSKYETKAALTIHSCDLSESDQVKKTFAEIKMLHKSSLVGLINNAGTWTGGKKIIELSREDIQNSLNLNFFTAFNCIRESIDQFYSIQDRQNFAIINVGATASLRGSKGSAAFAVAKASLRILSQALAKELGPEGIHVAHVVVDGLIDNKRTRGLNPNRPSNRYMSMGSLAKEIMHLMEQSQDCWTFELDCRTYNAEW